MTRDQLFKAVQEVLSDFSYSDVLHVMKKDAEQRLKGVIDPEVGASLEIVVAALASAETTATWNGE